MKYPSLFVKEVCTSPTLWYTNRHLWAFLTLFLFRYLRAIANCIANVRYAPIPIPERPTYFPSDLTIVISTTGLNNQTFHNVVSSILVHPVSSLIIATSGHTVLTEIQSFEAQFPDSRITVLHRIEANRREQTAMAVKLITTALMVVSDDHTFWPATEVFLPSLIAPFEDPKVGGVGPVLEAHHHHHPKPSWEGFFNFLGMAYLLRRAHEFIATTSIDGGISTLSARFAVFRTEIYSNPKFLQEYLNEYIFFNLIGPLNSDDDKFHTRWLANHGWDIKIQAGPESTMVTELGEWPRFIDQCVRWNRTTYRPNPRALISERVSWVRFPYTTYAHLVYAFFRVTLFYEITLMWLLAAGLRANSLEVWTIFSFSATMIWCTGMKAVKLIPHFRKYPQDIVYFPGYILFGWFCTGIKMWAAVSCWNIYWATASAATKKPLDADVDKMALLGFNGLKDVEIIDVIVVEDGGTMPQYMDE